MKDIIPHPPARPGRAPGEPWTAGTLAAELVWQDWSETSYDDLTERRIIALEEALCSRRARRRLRREIRRQVARFAWAGPSFRARRFEGVVSEWLSR